MPKLTRKLPKMRHYKPRNLARVRINGKEIYLGKWESAEAQEEYERVLANYLANGRQLKLVEEEGEEDVPADLLVSELLDRYWEHAKKEYGEVPGTPAMHMKPLLREFRELYGRTSGKEFGPRKLKAFRASWIRKGLSRKYINQSTWRLREVFRWSASEELIPASVPVALDQVTGLRRRHTRQNGVQESKPVKPVDDPVVEATLPHLPAIVADMVRLQRLTGARPTEICLLRPCDVDRSGDIWTYTPERHKTEHFGKQRATARSRANTTTRPPNSTPPDVDFIVHEWSAVHRWYPLDSTDLFPVSTEHGSVAISGLPFHGYAPA